MAQKAHARIVQIVEETVASFGGICEVRIETGYPCLINEPELTKKSNRMLVIILEKNMLKNCHCV